MVATTVILPMDFIKVHMQCCAEGGGVKVRPINFVVNVYQQQGILAFYNGLSSALLRQALYATTRLGLYKSLSDREKVKTGSESIPFFKKFIFSIASGGIGAIVGNPCDLALIRLQLDNTLPPESRRNYKGCIDALIRIPREEGITAYWRGCMPTVLRACALNFGMLAPYDQLKEYLDKQTGPSPKNRFYSSIAAAVLACTISLPFDNIKTKYQRMIKGKDGLYPYSGFSDCFLKSVKSEGFMGLYVGFPVFVMRVAPHVIITLLTVDYLHLLLDKK